MTSALFQNRFIGRDKCFDPYQISRHLNNAFLRIANVNFVVLTDHRKAVINRYLLCDFRILKQVPASIKFFNICRLKL